MSDFLATALGLAFALIVCLLALQAILSPWLRVRRARASDASRRDNTQVSKSAQHAAQPETTPVQMV